MSFEWRERLNIFRRCDKCENFTHRFIRIGSVISTTFLLALMLIYVVDISMLIVSDAYSWNIRTDMRDFTKNITLTSLSLTICT